MSIGKHFKHIRGTMNLYLDPITKTVWWKRPSGLWQQVEVKDSGKGKYVKISISLEAIMEMLAT